MNRPVLRSLTINRSNLSPPGDPTSPDAPSAQPLPTATSPPPPEPRTAAHSPTYYPSRPPRTCRRRAHVPPRPKRDLFGAQAALPAPRFHLSSRLHGCPDLLPHHLAPASASTGLWRRGRRRSWTQRGAPRRGPRPYRRRQERLEVLISRRSRPTTPGSRYAPCGQRARAGRDPLRRPRRRRRGPPP